MAPEYVMHGVLSVKADVFSFGVVVLELISGQKNSSFSMRHPDQTLLDWVKPLVSLLSHVPLFPVRAGPKHRLVNHWAIYKLLLNCL